MEHRLLARNTPPQEGDLPELEFFIDGPSDGAYSKNTVRLRVLCREMDFTVAIIAYRNGKLGLSRIGGMSGLTGVDENGRFHDITPVQD